MRKKIWRYVVLLGLIGWIPLDSEALKLTKHQAGKYKCLNQAYQGVHVSPHQHQPFLILIAGNPALAQWLDQTVNTNGYWNTTLINNAEGWFNLSQSHPDFIQALAAMAGSHDLLGIFNFQQTQTLLTTYPKTSMILLQLLQGQTRFALELFNNIDHLSDAASQAGDEVMQHYLQTLTANAQNISELMLKLEKLKCLNLNAILLQFLITMVFTSGHSVNLVHALLQLTNNHGVLLQAVSNQGNENDEIMSLFKEMSRYSNPNHVETVAQQALNQQNAATSSLYCLKTFFIVFGINLLINQKR